MPRPFFRFVLLLALALCPWLPSRPASAASSLRPATAGSVAEIDHALARLSGHRRLLMIGAHPDDEDTRLLALVARGLAGEAAYLSLSRGEGGQNLIGTELGIGLGLVRARELAAAREIDGARQFFTRAYDFGYTRSLDETLARWPKEALLEDAVRVVRRFKPQVLSAVFPPTPAAGHGQHQASGLVAEEVLELAADAAAFPHLLAEGLEPWTVEAFYRSAWWNPTGATLELPLGEIDPESGRSVFQLSLASRSQHRSQDMGLLQPPGDASTHLAWVSGAGDPAAAVEPGGLFAGIDTRLSAIADLLPTGERRRLVRDQLEQVGALAASVRGALTPANPGVAVAPLGQILGLLRGLQGDLRASGEGSAHALALVDEKLGIAQEALASAARVVADAVTDREVVVAGESFEVRALLWAAGAAEVSDVSIEVSSPAGWLAGEQRPSEPERSRFATDSTVDRTLEVRLPDDALPTVPYFLRRPLLGDLYDWRDVVPAERGVPFAPPPLSLRFRFTVAGQPVELTREVVHRHRDQALGEIRRPLRAAPALEVMVEPARLVWAIGSRQEARLRVELRSNQQAPVSGRVEVVGPASWPSSPPVSFHIAEARGSEVLELPLAAPTSLAPGRVELAVTATTDGGRRFSGALTEVDYPHIRPTPWPEPSRVEVSAADIRWPDLERLGYLRGASDRVPEMLFEIGLPLTLLDAGSVAGLDLTIYDAIVIGSRAFETDAALAAANTRLLEYARGGGLLIVQYQQYPFVRGGHAPYPLDISRPHDRITDETASVRLLEPEHPVFHVPNLIGEVDWQGWVQERGLYFAGTWDARYRPLLAMADPGGEEKLGGLLVAELGAGHYVYTGLAFFRQLPAGVPGAYRLLANLLAIGREDP